MTWNRSRTRGAFAYVVDMMRTTMERLIVIVEIIIIYGISIENRKMLQVIVSIANIIMKTKIMLETMPRTNIKIGRDLNGSNVNRCVNGD